MGVNQMGALYITQSVEASVNIGIFPEKVFSIEKQTLNALRQILSMF